MYTYRGRRDRELEDEKRRYVSLAPTTPNENLIKSTVETVNENWRSIPLHVAVESYLNLRDARHNVWIDFCQNFKKIPNAKFGDIKVSTFIKGLEFFDVFIPPEVYDKWKNKTPDILIFDPRVSLIYIGDIAVSLNVQSAYQRKYEKYFDLAKSLRLYGLRVQHINMIVQAELIGVQNTINQMVCVGLIEYSNEGITKACHYHDLANKAMDDCKTRCENPKMFNEYISKVDKIREEEKLILNIDTGILPEYKPIRTEDEIIEMIKQKTDSVIDGYYDNGYKDAESKFNELYTNFKARPHKKPKSTLKIVHNSHDIESTTGYDLLKNYIQDIATGDDEVISNYLLNILPSLDQIDLMQQCTQDNYKDNKFKNASVFGPWQYYRRTKYPSNFLTLDMNSKLLITKKNPNLKEEPTTIDPIDYNLCIDTINSMINTLGEESEKPSFLDETWDSVNINEDDNTMDERENYNFVKKTCGAQLGHSLSNFYQRLTHIRSALSTKDNIYIPPNASFITFIPKNHAPYNQANANCPMITITRKLKTSQVNIHEYEFQLETNNYIYYVSKLSRLPLNKMAHWDQAGHKIVACSSYISSLNQTMKQVRKQIVGIMTILALDLHQKTSELLDLLKYVSFMPFSNLSRLSKLIDDKFNIMLKTSLDVWVIKMIEDFMYRLSTPGNVTGIKERTKVFCGKVIESCLGMKITIPSFINRNQSHTKIQDFVEEISSLNMMRGKQFYGSQFMDKSIGLTAQWNKDFEDEQNLYGDWVHGHDNTPFPFDSKFCFSSDAIYYSQKYREHKYPLTQSNILNKLNSIDYDTYIHNICSLRGCTKEKYQRKNLKDLHTTSMDACLTYYETIGYNEKESKIPVLANLTAHTNYTPQYTMSEKEQRGGGRPIATPTLKAKVMNAAIEKPEQAIGALTDNNILVAGKHKTKTQSKTYKELLEQGYANKKKEVYQVTEDQTKFSENDNHEKYLTYIRANELLPMNIRYIQYKCMEKNTQREHLVKHIPHNIINDPSLAKYLNDEGNGVKAIIGWPQGMFNNISTSIHQNADLWITYAYNRVYNKNIQVKGLVHSDDSWYAIACDSEYELRQFSIFRIYAKKLFCLKTNDKKFWTSKLMGELISNYSINGEVLLSIIKVLANGFSGLLYQNWPMDVSTQISSLQQLYRQGANIGTLIMAATILRQQIISAYNISPDIKNLISTLPIEMGGYPKLSAYELGVCGTAAHYKSIMDNIIKDETNPIGIAIKKTMYLSMIYSKKREEMDIIKEIQPRTQLRNLIQHGDVENESYSTVILPQRGEVFSVIKHIMPKSRKVAKTVNKIKNLPFVSDGLEMLITKPKRLSDSLGHLKAQTSSMIYELAAEKYSGNKRRLAMNQAIQASGRTVKIAGLRPMTMSEMLGTLLELGPMQMPEIEQLEAAFSDSSNIVQLTNLIVHQSDMSVINPDKRHVVNRMPDFEDKFNTICPLRNVLLYIVDKRYSTSYREEYAMDKDIPEIIEQDSELIVKRFKSYFEYYDTKTACNLIMQQYFTKINPRLWMQPRLRNDTMENFLTDLYGKSLNSRVNYLVTIDYKEPVQNKHFQNIVNTLYTVTLLNEMYGKFEINTICNYKPHEILRQIDYSTLAQFDFLKYAVLCKIYLNDDIMLKKYDESKEYSQTYLKPQEIRKGIFFGDFEVICRYGNCVARINGKPGNLKLYINKPVINDLLMLMYLFVQRNHPDHKYSSPLQWHLTKFWCSLVPGELQLRCYGQNVNILKLYSPTSDGLSVNIIPSLIYPYTGSISIGQTYSIEENLRLVFKTTQDYYGRVSKIRVDSVKQNMSCPLIDKVVLHTDIIDGFINQDLLKSKIILNISMRRSFSAPTNIIRDILKSRVTQTTNVSIARTFFYFMKIVKNDIQNLEIEEQPDDIIEIELEAGEIGEFMDRHLDTEPEVLDAVELGYIYDETDRLGATVKHTNIYRFLCKCISPVLNVDDVASIFKEIIKKHQFREIYDNSVEFLIENSVEEFLSLSCEVETLSDTCYTLIANNLDIDRTLKGITPNMIKSARQPTQLLYNISNNIYKCLTDMTIGETVDPVDDFLD